MISVLLLRYLIRRYKLCKLCRLCKRKRRDQSRVACEPENIATQTDHVASTNRETQFDINDFMNYPEGRATNQRDAVSPIENNLERPVYNPYDRVNLDLHIAASPQQDPNEQASLRKIQYKKIMDSDLEYSTYLLGQDFDAKSPVKNVYQNFNHNVRTNDPADESNSSMRKEFDINKY